MPDQRCAREQLAFEEAPLWSLLHRLERAHARGLRIDRPEASGPSVVDMDPLRTRTVVADAVGRRR
jgi:hypothetical protein